LVPTSQLALVHIHKVADRKVDVEDTAAKTPMPTTIMRYSEVQRQCWPHSSRDENGLVIPR